MDVDCYITESATFTRRVLAGGCSRWLILVLLGLPWTVLVTRLQDYGVFDGITVRWAQVPWGEAGLLIAAGVACNLLLSGYLVRLFAGGDAPPVFDRPARLTFDGIRLHVIPLVWAVVPLILAAAEYRIVSAGLTSPGSSWEIPALALIVVLAIVQFVILWFAASYIVIGTTRFARTGSVREAFNIPAIKATLDRVGIVNYFIGLGVIALVFLAATGLLNLLSLFPRIGPYLTLALGPVVTVFCIRFLAHFSDEDTPAVPPAQAAGTAVLVLFEFVAWTLVLAVLVILCFTPLAAVFGLLRGLLF